MEIHILSGWSPRVIRQILRWAAGILVVCVLLFGLAAGIDWLSNQSWGDNGCPDGMSLYQVDHYFKNGSFDYTAVWCQ